MLVTFLQANTDNVSLNEPLELAFSEAVDAASITPASIQIREGSSFGKTVPGTFYVDGAKVTFEPNVAGLCDLSDSGLLAGTNYRVMLVGYPEQFAIRNTHGQPLRQTLSFEFRTRSEQDPLLFRDQIPGASPALISSTPVDGDAAVDVALGNRVVLTMSENLEPCSVSSATVRFFQHEVGDLNAFLQAPNQNDTGFDSITDMSPNPYSWGATNSTAQVPPQQIPAHVTLEQGFSGTQIVITPVSGRFPDNALLAVDLTPGIRDFGGQLMTPTTIAFTTENIPPVDGEYSLHFAGETPIDDALTTADVNTARAPSLAQGYLLFAGDGDNGMFETEPSMPETPASGCTVPRQANDNSKDDFDPAANILLDTGAPNTCANGADGSTGVIWEFRTLRIRSGVVVRIAGSNPAILLIQGDALIENGGVLRVRGDNQGGAPRGDGQNGSSTTSNSNKAGGIGVAGGGDGGTSYSPGSQTYGGHGFAGFGSDDYDANMTDNGTGDGGQGAGQGGVSNTNSDSFGSGASQGGGGGGHSVAGVAGTGSAGQNLYGSVHSFNGPLDGAGGLTYPSGAPATVERMLTPAAGSGGGAAGDSRGNGGSYDSIGGSGGAGGGFIDITCGGEITIFGTIDAAGGRGGTGYYDASFTASGGGGGGSGGGIRLLTPNDINISDATLTTAGGPAGGASSPTNNPNLGGAGGHGRIVMEDGDSVITGMGSATLIPTEGESGFYRGKFDATRFKGGGLAPAAVTGVFLLGPLNASIVSPVQADFIAGIPAAASRGIGTTSILVEIEGYPLLPNGSPNIGASSGWRTAGYFTDSGIDNQPTWVAGVNPGDVTPPSDNAGAGLAPLAGSAYVRVRISTYLPSSIGPQAPGPYMDLWTIRHQSDQ